MSLEKVRTYFSRWQMQSRVRELDQSSATVELAALALHCAPERIAKSLAFLVDEKAIVVVVAGDARIDNPKYKARFGKKAKMLPAELTESLVGHRVGGVCPFALNPDVAVYLDVSLRRFETVFPACGSSNSCIELTIDELVQYSGSSDWVDVCKAWQTDPAA